MSKFKQFNIQIFEDDKKAIEFCKNTNLPRLIYELCYNGQDGYIVKDEKEEVFTTDYTKARLIFKNTKKGVLARVVRDENGKYNFYREIYKK